MTNVTARKTMKVGTRTTRGKQEDKVQKENVLAKKNCQAKSDFNAFLPEKPKVRKISQKVGLKILHRVAFLQQKFAL